MEQASTNLFVAVMHRVSFLSQKTFDERLTPKMSERFKQSFTEDRIFEARVSFRGLLSSVDEKGSNMIDDARFVDPQSSVCSMAGVVL